MAGIILPRDLLPGLAVAMSGAYKEVVPEWKAIYKEMPADNMSKSEAMSYAGMDLPVEKPLGEDISYTSMSQLYRSELVYTPYALGFSITHEELQWGQQVKVGTQRAREIGRVFAVMQNIRAADVLNLGFSQAAYHSGNEGSNLFATSHAIDGGTTSNRASADAALSEAALEQAILDVEAIKDNKGYKAGLNAQKLVVPSVLQFDAHRIVKSDGRVGVADNDLNALKSMGKLQDVVVMKYLTSSTAWFLTTDAPDFESLIHMEQEALNLKEQEHFNSMDMRMRAYQRDLFGSYGFRGVYGSAGA